MSGMKQKDYNNVWDEIEEHKAPCRVKMLCDCKKTYTGAGTEYTPLWSVTNQSIPLQLEEIRRGKNNVLWGRLKSGEGWIDLTEVQLCE